MKLSTVKGKNTTIKKDLRINFLCFTRLTLFQKNLKELNQGYGNFSTSFLSKYIEYFPHSYVTNVIRFTRVYSH